MKSPKVYIRGSGILDDLLGIESMRDLELPISAAHASQAGGLPPVHDDPFDRMLVAQAQLEGLTLVSADKRLSRYSVSLLDW